MLARELAASRSRRSSEALWRLRAMALTFARSDTAITATLLIAIASLIAIALLY